MAWREALAILDRLRHPLANKVRARLRDLDRDLMQQI
jgi:hypothetical protein